MPIRVVRGQISQHRHFAQDQARMFGYPLLCYGNVWLPFFPGMATQLFYFNCYILLNLTSLDQIFTTW